MTEAMMLQQILDATEGLREDVRHQTRELATLSSKTVGLEEQVVGLRRDIDRHREELDSIRGDLEEREKQRREAERRFREDLDIVTGRLRDKDSAQGDEIASLKTEAEVSKRTSRHHGAVAGGASAGGVGLLAWLLEHIWG